MKKFFNKLGFHKMDEMERHIAFKAQRNAYLFLIVTLLIWSFYESYKVFAFHTSLNLLPSMLLTAACGIQLFSQLAMASNVVKDEESYKTSPFLKVVIWCCVIVAIVITIGAVMVIMGVGA